MPPVRETAEFWKKVAYRIARYFTPSGMPQTVIDMICADIEREMKNDPARR